MPKLKWSWMRSINAIFMNEREERVREHRERISRDLRVRGIPEGDALKVCCIDGCYQETIECWTNRLKKWGWLKIDSKWYCPQHSQQQREAC